MTIGEKIKARRRELGYTQSEVSGEFISRNMLSLIESGNATPSLETLRYLADALRVPVEYLVSEDESLSRFLRMRSEEEIFASYAQKSYDKTVLLIESLGQIDDLTAMLGAEAAYRCARSKLAGGSLESAKSYINKSLGFLQASKFDSPLLRAKCVLAASIVENINSPKLHFNENEYLELMKESTEEEFYRYYSSDFSYPYQNEILSLHMKAKEQMKKRNYLGAVSMLTEAEDKKNAENYDAFVFLGIYNDLESCYKELGDFERAYRYASKRISMMEYMKS